jgi:hypothetical protein
VELRHPSPPVPQSAMAPAALHLDFLSSLRKSGFVSKLQALRV